MYSWGEGRGEGRFEGRDELLTLTISPAHRGEGTRGNMRSSCYIMASAMRNLILPTEIFSKLYEQSKDVT
jgi:hypothetical protein